MKLRFQRLGALLLTLAVMLGTVPAAFAAQEGTFGNERGRGFSRGHFADASKRFLYDVKGYTAHDNGDLCSKSTESLHMAREWTRGGGFNTDVKYMCKCFRCGQMFDVYESDITRSYSEHTKSLPATGYGSDGSLYVSPNHDYSAIFTYINFNFNLRSCSHSTSESKLSEDLGTFSCSNPFVFRSHSSSGVSSRRFQVRYKFTCSVDGKYSWGSGYTASGSIITDSGSSPPVRISADSSFGDSAVKYAGDTVYFTVNCVFDDNIIVRATLNAPEPKLKVTPLESVSNDYPSDSRPGGSGFYFHLGDDSGKLFSDNKMNIVLETDGIYYNPVTGNTYNMDGWTYDYSSRTYNFTANNTSTSVTYGDEYITIKEGDTIYNVYYYVAQDSDQDTSCKHSYTSTVTTAATCEAPGFMTYTCSKCGDTYTEKIPATGHTWQVKQTVKTEYDEGGNVTQQGYTVYKCAICGTEYKDDAGTGPPSTPGGNSGSGGSIWDKLGNLVGSALGGIVSIIEGVVSKFLDALISLVGMLVDKLNVLVEGVMGIFEALPTIFSGFTGFLGATFAFLPEDLLMVLEFGFIAVIFVGLLTMIFRR